MDSIIEKICNMQIEEDNYPFGRPDKVKLNREWEIYNYLYEHLSAKDKKLFIEYAELVADRNNREKMEACKKGFRIAMQITIDSFEK